MVFLLDLSMDSDSLNLAVIDVTFPAIGDDERIHQLNKITKRRLYGAKRRVSDYYYIGLKLGKARQEKNIVGTQTRKTMAGYLVVYLLLSLLF